MLKLTIALMLATIACVSAIEKCNTFTANCFIDPCMIPSKNGCEAYPDAKCVSNYCGGCNYDWVYNGAKVDCVKKEKRQILSILGGLFPNLGCNMVTCFVQPCAYASCAAYPNAECRDNYCNGCSADFYVNNVKVKC